MPTSSISPLFLRHSVSATSTPLPQPTHPTPQPPTCLSLIRFYDVSASTHCVNLSATGLILYTAISAIPSTIPTAASPNSPCALTKIPSKHSIASCIYDVRNTFVTISPVISSYPSFVPVKLTNSAILINPTYPSNPCLPTASTLLLKNISFPFSHKSIITRRTSTSASIAYDPSISCPNASIPLYTIFVSALSSSPSPSFSLLLSSSSSLLSTFIFSIAIIRSIPISPPINFRSCPFPLSSTLIRYPKSTHCHITFIISTSLSSYKSPWLLAHGSSSTAHNTSSPVRALISTPIISFLSISPILLLLSPQSFCVAISATPIPTNSRNTALYNFPPLSSLGCKSLTACHNTSAFPSANPSSTFSFFTGIYTFNIFSVIISIIAGIHACFFCYFFFLPLYLYMSRNFANFGYNIPEFSCKLPLYPTFTPSLVLFYVAIGPISPALYVHYFVLNL
ncbi:hypothetical protein AX774_g4283 [Zancudomyces culisetae]|uniref:Uncharacterized protein n=1 Tax=Zancudomyces culisetae TaxID=1213189 RepID=A0A1R1PMW4_ZANCU|nr:hypothetical protein AX774_g4283 [Zancudomyces culisetae]|eukprot:OMH82242.1 hypothetical protein AX774_g4283 [Zancudomyces culisetae]